MQDGKEFIDMISAEDYVPDESFYRRIFAQRLNDIRRERKISQRTLAEGAGVSVAFISDCERAKRTPKFKELYALTKYLQISIDDLVGHTLENSKDVLNYRFERALELVEASGNDIIFADKDDSCTLIIFADKETRDLEAEDNYSIDFETRNSFAMFVEVVEEKVLAEEINFAEAVYDIMDWWENEGKEKFEAKEK